MADVKYFRAQFWGGKGMPVGRKDIDTGARSYEDDSFGLCNAEDDDCE